MQALAVEVIQIIRADPATVRRDCSTISLMIATHEDSDAFVLALAYAARNMPDEVVWCLDICITDVVQYEHFSVTAQLRALRARANFRAG
jgi:hypothetical protein